MYVLDGFTSVAVCREDSDGGGLLIFIKEQLTFSVIDHKLNQAESILLKVEKADKKAFCYCSFIDHRVQTRILL